ncbi:hypothetical protein [Planomicrobium okeanokoites]|uniref:DUF4178 domain-containing protein n=1 Tax=Planomicrobium okeanokoites TaxID=244 RepID=A0ABV7KTB2_PLAOK|nr:hypothetical protein [Planomicrobium okeanokoites]TAA70274.1 hypothetical protein D2910_07435 [Planomicrobium okeanokoites]
MEKGIGHMTHSNEEKRKLVSIDLTEGKRVFDTSKMDDWSQEEWEAFVGDENDHQHHLEIPLLNTNDYHFLISSVYLNEATKIHTLEMQIENRTEKDLSVLVKELKLDDKYFDIYKNQRYLVKAHEKSEGKVEVLAYGDIYDLFNHSLFMCIDIEEAQTGKWLEGYEFDVKVFPEQ